MLLERPLVSGLLAPTTEGAWASGEGQVKCANGFENSLEIMVGVIGLGLS